jgi:hypothetical protein
MKISCLKHTVTVGSPNRENKFAFNQLQIKPMLHLASVSKFYYVKRDCTNAPSDSVNGINGIRTPPTEMPLILRACLTGPGLG